MKITVYILCAALSAVAFPNLAISAPGISPAQFNARLILKVGSKKSLKAANAAVKYFGNIIKDYSNKKYTHKYAKSVVKRLRNRVPDSLKATTTFILVQHLLSHYFTNDIKFDLYDKTFNVSLAIFLEGLPPTARTEATSNTLFNIISNYALKRGYTPEQIYIYFHPNYGES